MQSSPITLWQIGETMEAVTDFISSSRVVSSAYLRLLIFLPAVLIPACASSNPAFHMMYSAYKLNKQGDNIQPCHTPYPVLTVAS